MEWGVEELGRGFTMYDEVDCAEHIVFFLHGNSLVVIWFVLNKKRLLSIEGSRCIICEARYIH